MKNDKYLLIGIAALTITIFLWGARWYTHSQDKKQTSPINWNGPPLIRSYSPSLGNADARVTIVEFLDPECEACSALFPVVKKVLKEFDDDQVRLIVRYMPFHGNSAYAASILEAARKQGKYWEALETLFERQPDWASHHQPKPELLLGYMKDLGLDMERVSASLQDEEVRSKIKQDEEDGRQVGVTGTPTFFVNGKKLEHLGYEPLKSAIEAELSQE